MPRATAWYGSDGVSAVRPPAGRSESDRWQESGEASSRLDACDFPATDRVVLPDGPVADYPVTHINARLESLPLVLPARPATRHDDGGYRHSSVHRECPNFGTPT